MRRDSMEGYLNKVHVKVLHARYVSDLLSTVLGREKSLNRAARNDCLERILSGRNEESAASTL